MKTGFLFLLSLGFGVIGLADEASRKLELAGDGAQARARLKRAADGANASIDALRDWAEFQERRKEPGARAAYAKLLERLSGGGNADLRRETARRLVLLDVLENDRTAAEKHLADYRAAGGNDLTLPAIKAPEAPPSVEIPGPLRSFARMAALSPDLNPADVLGALARNVVTNGYQAASSNEALEQTEYLKLVVRYLSQARELTKLAGEGHAINIENCESTQTADLLKVLGYRMRGACGSEVVLETVNATRAFLTIDSGFPLAELEQALRTNRPFKLDYKPTVVPVLYGPEYWLSSREKPSDKYEFIDYFLGDPSLCRLYLGMSKLDRETADELRKAMPANRIRAYSHVLDFFGGMFQIRGGKAIVPGAPKTTAMWTELAGASPDQGSAFLEKLISKDDGWLASYFDALLRLNGRAQDYLLEPERLKRFYTAIRGRVTSPGPARPVFRSNTDMLLLTTRLRMESDGRVHIPGGVEVWRQLFVEHPHGKYDGKLTKSATAWKDADEVLEALFGLSRKAVENEPLKMFMALSDLNRRRAQPLAPATVSRILRDYRNFSSQLPIFSESPNLSDKTIVAYLDTAAAINQVRDMQLRADIVGSMQGLVGLWQIFVRQGIVSAGDADTVLAEITGAFAKTRNNRDLFDAGRAGTRLLLKSAGVAQGADPQSSMVDLLVGAAKVRDSESHQALVQEMIRIFETQRLVSLKTLFDLADHLEAVAKGEKLNTQLVGRLASRISEIQPPRVSLTGVEKNALSFGYWTEKHIDTQRKVNLKALADRSANDPQKLADARGQLAPFLRDTLVGLNYVHYAPPGAQILYTNPVFVRSHDFVGVQGANQTWRNTEVLGTGWPSSAGGRLVGSLAGLPYALAEAEQNFMIPSREQALIWGDLVPQMILAAKIPRWWNVSPAQLHWVGLHMRAAEALLAEAALHGTRRGEVVESLSKQMAPARVKTVAGLLENANIRDAIDNITPAELFLLAADVLARNASVAGPAAAEIKRMALELPNQASYPSVSRAFGTPKPTLANSYQPELLNLRTFPTLMGYSSRILAESWESNLLFYAALADETYLLPSQMNVTVPQWTQKTVERIFATHLEDWPALLRSMRMVGDDVRSAARKQIEAGQQASVN